MDFIFMLTRDDRTVEDCARAARADRAARPAAHRLQGRGCRLRPAEGARAAIKATGAVSYMEVVSTTPEAELRSAPLARALGVDRLLGGTQVDEIMATARREARLLSVPRQAGRSSDEARRLRRRGRGAGRALRGAGLRRVRYPRLSRDRGRSDRAGARRAEGARRGDADRRGARSPARTGFRRWQAGGGGRLHHRDRGLRRLLFARQGLDPLAAQGRRRRLRRRRWLSRHRHRHAEPEGGRDRRRRCGRSASGRVAYRAALSAARAGRSRIRRCGWPRSRPRSATRCARRAWARAKSRRSASRGSSTAALRVGADGEAARAVHRLVGSARGGGESLTSTRIRARARRAGARSDAYGGEDPLVRAARRREWRARCAGTSRSSYVVERLTGAAVMDPSSRRRRCSMGWRSAAMPAICSPTLRRRRGEPAGDRAGGSAGGRADGAAGGADRACRRASRWRSAPGTTSRTPLGAGSSTPGTVACDARDRRGDRRWLRFPLHRPGAAGRDAWLSRPGISSSGTRGGFRAGR